MTKARLFFVRTAIAILAIGMLFFGAMRGEAKTVLQKAVMICFECIGIG